MCSSHSKTAGSLEICYCLALRPCGRASNICSLEWLGLREGQCFYYVNTCTAWCVSECNWMCVCEWCASTPRVWEKENHCENHWKGGNGGPTLQHPLCQTVIDLCQLPPFIYFCLGLSLILHDAILFLPFLCRYQKYTKSLLALFSSCLTFLSYNQRLCYICQLKRRNSAQMVVAGSLYYLH